MDFDMSLYYYPGKSNLAVNALSMLSIEILALVAKDKWELKKDIHHLSNLEVYLANSENGGLFVH